MDENTRKKVIEIIRETIDEVVYDEMRQMPKKLQAKQEEMSKTKAQRAQDAHDALFGKKEEEHNYKLQLHENEEKPKVLANELSQFEKEFKSHFPGISFDKQSGNGQIVDFPIKDGKTDAITSGTITVGQDKIGFSMSLTNGLKIESVADNGMPKEFEINKDTKDVFGKLLNLYEEVFKKKFNEIINPQEEGGTGEEAGETMTAASVAHPAMPGTPPAGTPPAGTPPV